MSEKERKEILESLDRKIPKLSEEQKHFVLGYMEGVTQRPEEVRRTHDKEQVLIENEHQNHKTYNHKRRTRTTNRAAEESNRRDSQRERDRK